MNQILFEFTPVLVLKERDMTYEELVKEAEKALKNLDLKTAPEHLAVEFDVEGEGEGAFYVEFTQKKAKVEPYEYYDHDLRVRDNAEQILKLLKGEVSCYEVNVEGFAEELSFLKNRKAARKATTAKKTATTAKKATKTVAKKATTTAKKAAKTADKASK